MPDLPPYLHCTDPMEIEDLPLQVALLTMEVAAIRSRLEELLAPTPPIEEMVGAGAEWLTAHPISRYIHDTKKSRREPWQTNPRTQPR